MKKNLAIALCTLVCLCACHSNDPDKLFARHWRLSSFSSQALDRHLAEMQAMLDTVKDSAKIAKLKQAIQMQNMYVQDMDKMTMSCNPDGSYKTVMVVIGQKQEGVGTWQLVDLGKRVILSKNNDMTKADTLNVTKLTRDELTLSAPDGQGGNVYMYYKAMKD